MLGWANSLLLALPKDTGLCETRGESSESGRSGKSAWCWWLVRRWLGTPRDGRTCTDTIPSPFTLFFLDFWKVLLLSEPRFLEMLIKLEQNSMRRLRGITSAVRKSWCCTCSCTFQYTIAVLVSFPFGPSTCCPVVRRLLRQSRSGASRPQPATPTPFSPWGLPLLAAWA